MYVPYSDTKTQKTILTVKNITNKDAYRRDQCNPIYILFKYLMNIVSKFKLLEEARCCSRGS